MYACMHACMYACMYVCKHVGLYAGLYVCVCVSVYVCECVSMYVCMYDGCDAHPRPQTWVRHQGQSWHSARVCFEGVRSAGAPTYLVCHFGSRGEPGSGGQNGHPKQRQRQGPPQWGALPLALFLGTEIDPQNWVCLQGRYRSRVLNSVWPAHKLFLSL
jgi:hypothetical protein